MINLHLTRDNYHEGVYLQLPATPAEIGEAFAELDEISTHTASTRIVGAISPILNIGQYIKSADVNSPEVMGKLNTLAGRITGMSRQEKAIFSGVLEAEAVNGLDDVLQLAEQTGQYVLIHDVVNDEELGEFLVASGYMDFPERVRPYLDYAEIGAEYFAEYGGAYTSAGYVMQKHALQEQPSISPTVFFVYLRTSGTPADCRIRLPVTDGQAIYSKAYLDITDWAQASITKIVCACHEVDGRIPMDAFNVEDANELSIAIVEMLRADDGGLDKYLAVLSVEQPDTLPAALRLAGDLDDYELVPDDAYEYGVLALKRVCRDQEVLDTIDGYMDFEGLGLSTMEADGVRKTEFGSIIRLSSPFPAPEQGQRML